jgi:hypothetical protein
MDSTLCETRPKKDRPNLQRSTGAFGKLTIAIPTPALQILSESLCDA